MGFIAPALPFIAKIGTAIGSSILGNKLTGGIPDIAQQPYQNLQKVQDVGLQNAQTLLPQGQNLIGQAVSAYQPALNYLTQLAGGDRSAVAAALAPDINRIAQTYSAQQQTANQLMPRGGGRADVMTAAPYQQAQTMLDLYQRGRQQAVAQLPGVAQGIGALANPLFSAATSGLNAATSAGQSMLNFAYNQNQANRQAGGQLGQSIFDILNPPGGGSIFDKLGSLGSVKASPGMLNLGPGYSPAPQPGTAGFQMPTLIGGPNYSIGATPSTTGSSLLWGG